MFNRPPELKSRRPYFYIMKTKLQEFEEKAETYRQENDFESWLKPIAELAKAEGVDLDVEKYKDGLTAIMIFVPNDPAAALKRYKDLKIRVETLDKLK